MQQRAFYIFITVFILLNTGCSDPFHKKTDWSVSLKNTDKTPYGTYLAYNSLKDHFPDAEINSLSKWSSFNNLDKEVRRNYNGPTLLILEGLSFNLTQAEWDHLLEFANDGNEVLLFSSYPDRKIMNKLHCNKKMSGMEEYPLSLFNTGEKNIEALTLKNTAGKYGYNGHSIQGYFEEDTTNHNDDDVDTSYANIHYTVADIPDTLGYVKGKANMIRYAVGEGHITLHAAPLVLSNYFLLQNDNKRYLSGLWSTLPADITHVYWLEYYKRSLPVSGANVMWRYPATRFATILAILGLLIYVLFESKRRQRIIPIVPPLQNSSVSFVETVGRLYYNKKNHMNLADKMINHFLEWVRNTYFINTNQINDSFIEQLTVRSGQPEETVRNLAHMIHETRLRNAIGDEAYLYELYNTIQQFYKSKT